MATVLPAQFRPENLLRFIQLNTFSRKWAQLGLTDDDLKALELMKKSTPRFTAAGAEIIGALTEFRDALRAKTPIDRMFTVRTVVLDLQPRAYGAEDVKKTREILNVSQAIFAKFLGVDVKTVRSWEQGLKQPSPIACRFMDEISFSPKHWRDRLRQVVARRETQSAKC